MLSTNVILVTPRIKKSLDFLSNFNFITINLRNLAKYRYLILDTFDLSKYSFVAMISIFHTASCVFCGKWSAVVLCVLSESFIVLILWVKAWYLHFDCMLLSCHVHVLEWIYTLWLPDCKRTPCSKPAWYLMFKWQQRDSNPRPLKLVNEHSTI